MSRDADAHDDVQAARRADAHHDAGTAESRDGDAGPAEGSDLASPADVLGPAADAPARATDRQDAAGPPDDDALALAMALQGFLASRWLGALLMVYSFTHLYVFGLRPGASVPMALVVAAVFLLAGSLMWWRSRVYAQRLATPWAARWAGAADLFAYTAMVFWILFLLALWLLSRGVALF